MLVPIPCCLLTQILYFQSLLIYTQYVLLHASHCPTKTMIVEKEDSSYNIGCAVKSQSRYPIRTFIMPFNLLVTCFAIK